LPLWATYGSSAFAGSEAVLIENLLGAAEQLEVTL